MDVDRTPSRTAKSRRAAGKRIEAERLEHGLGVDMMTYREHERDEDGTTDNEEHEAITPHSSQGSIVKRPARRARPLVKGASGSVGSVHQVAGVSELDSETMDAALALCGLAGF